MATVQAHTGWPLKAVGMGKALWLRVKAILLGVFCFCFFSWRNTWTRWKNTQTLISGHWLMICPEDQEL